MALTLADILTKADPNLIADAFRKVNLGIMLTPVSETITLGAAATTLPLSVKSFSPGTMHVRVTAGVSVGKYVVSDSGGIAVDVGLEVGVCKLAADGLSLVFASNVTSVLVSYLAASESPLSDAFNDFV